MRKSLGGSGPIQALEARSIFIIEVVYRRQKIRRCPGVTSGCHVLYIFLLSLTASTKTRYRKKIFFFQVICAWQARFLPLRGVSFEKTIKTETNEEDGQRPSLTSAIMMSMNSKQPFSMHPILHEPKYTPLHSSSEAIRRACLPTPSVSPEFTRDFLQLLQNLQSPLTVQKMSLVYS